MFDLSCNLVKKTCYRDGQPQGWHWQLIAVSSQAKITKNYITGDFNVPKYSRTDRGRRSNRFDGL
jgi:hypothetical protein